MKRTLHFVNGMTAMMLGLVTLSIGATASFSNAAPLSKKLTPPQPKIVSIKTEVQGVSFGSVNDSLQWPSEAGTVNEVSDDTTGVSVTPSLQPGFYKAVKWAHTYQWSDDPVDPTSIVQNAVNLAKKYLNSGSFISKPQSVLVPVDAKAQAGKYVTIYSYVTNGDSSSPSFFPLGIDYAVATTFFVPLGEAQAYDESAAPEEESSAAAPETSTSEPQQQAKQLVVPKLTVQKMVDSPAGAAAVGAEQLIGKFIAASTDEVKLKKIAIDISSNISFSNNHQLALWGSLYGQQPKLLGQASLGGFKSGAIEIPLTEPYTLAAGDQFILMVKANTAAAATATQETTLQASVASISKEYTGGSDVQSVGVKGGVLVYPWAEPVVKKAEAQQPAEPVKPSIANAANAPSGAVSKSSEQTVAKFVLTAPANAANQTLKVSGLFMAINSTIKFGEDRTFSVYKSEVATSANVLATKTLKNFGADGGMSGFVPFPSPIFIQAGTSQVITIVAATQDASANDTFQAKILDVQTTTDAGRVDLNIQAVGKMLYY